VWDHLWSDGWLDSGGPLPTVRCLQGGRKVVDNTKQAPFFFVFIFFGIELSGCLGPETQHICKKIAGVGGEGPED
jgi:hypothetical protein